MADEAKIKQKIELSGEKEYNKALSDAKRNLRTLRSELKMETAELGRNATEQQKNEVRSKSLKKQIQEQEKVVQACQRALDEVREKYADNADAIATYEQKVNQARTTLANMNNALEDVSDGFDDVGSSAGTSLVETRSFAESIESLAGVADGVSTAIEGIFTGMLDVTRQAIGAVWGEVTELAGRANSWSDLAGYWNTSAENIQKWYHSVEGSFNSFEDLNNAVTRIVMGDQKKIAEATGVSSAAYEDQWEYAMSVMDAMSQMGYKERTAAAEDVFGEKRATKVMDLLNDWQKITALANGFDVANGGVGMSQEELDTMAAIAEQVATIEQKWMAFKDSFVAGVAGKLTLDLAGSAQGMLDSLILFMSADSQEERDQAISDLETHMTDFFTRLGEAIETAAGVLDKVGTEMQGSENGTVRAIGGMLTTLSNILNWFTDQNNIDLVAKGFETLLGIWAGTKMLSAVSNLAALGANLSTIRAGGGILGALFGRGVAGAAGNTVANTAGTAAATAGGATISALAGKALGALVKIAPYAAGLAVLFDHSNHGSNDIVNENGQLLPEAAAEGFTVTVDGDILLPENSTLETGEGGPGLEELIRMNEGEQAQEQLGETITEAQRAALEDWWDLMRRTPEDDLDSPVWDEFDAMWPQLEALFEGNQGLLETLEQRMDDAAWGNAGDDWRSYEDIPASVFDGIGTDMSGASRSLDSASAAMRGLPALMQAAVRSGVSNIQVYLDGQKVGNLVSPYVSQGIAREIM